MLGSTWCNCALGCASACWRRFATHSGLPADWKTPFVGCGGAGATRKNPKPQTREKSQIPNPKSQTNSNDPKRMSDLLVWILDLFGIWDLGFGILLRAQQLALPPWRRLAD